MTTRLKTHLQLIGMTQRELSAKIGAHPDTLSRLAKWNVGSKRLREKVSEALLVPVEELFPQEDND